MKRKKTIETGFRLLFLICGLIAVAFVLLISIYLIIAGIPAIREVGLINFLSGDTWNAGTSEFGILPFILTSVYGTAGAVVIGVPIGIMTALYLSKVAPPKIAKLVNTAVELLAGIPSVIYGLVGMIVVVPAVQSVFGLSSGACLLTAILVLAVMILPYIINISKTALDAVRPSTRKRRWRSVRSGPRLISRSRFRRLSVVSQPPLCRAWAERWAKRWR